MHVQFRSTVAQFAPREKRVLSSVSKLALSLAAMFACTAAYAAPVGVTDNNGNGKIDLADVIASGNGFVIGDKLFSHFSYTPSGSNSPAASDISVDVSPGSTDQDESIRFGFGWFSINGINMDSRIDYEVSVLDPSAAIDGVDLLFNGLASGSAEAVVSETIQTLDGTFLGQIGVTTNPHAPANVLPLIPPQRAILVDKDIQLFSLPKATSTSPNNFSSISFVDNSYHQTVPEPVSAGVLGISCLALMRRRRSI